MGKSTRNGPVSIAILVYRRVACFPNPQEPHICIPLYAGIIWDMSPTSCSYVEEWQFFPHFELENPILNGKEPAHLFIFTLIYFIILYYIVFFILYYIILYYIILYIYMCVLVPTHMHTQNYISSIYTYIYIYICI